VDRKTLKIYDLESAKYTDSWISQPAPAEIYRRVQLHFKKGLPTADIGSGSGRDVAWLNAAGYPASGFDASAGLLEAARRRFPQFSFERAELPDLAEIADSSFVQILCETVLMHLAPETHERSIRNLLRVLSSGGVLLASWRRAEPSADGRDAAGRLYAPVDFDAIKAGPLGSTFEVLEDQEILSPSSGKWIREVVLQKKAS